MQIFGLTISNRRMTLSHRRIIYEHIATERSL